MTAEQRAWPTPDLRPRAGSWKATRRCCCGRPGDQPVPPVPPGLRVERVGGVGGLRDWEQVAVDGFPYRELQPYRPDELLDEGVLDDERLRLWVGYEGDRPVCIGSLFVDAGVASFSLGGDPAAGQAPRLLGGHGRGAPGRRHRPAGGGVFSDMSRPSAEALGFLPITRFTLWHRPRP